MRGGRSEGQCFLTFFAKLPVLGIRRHVGPLADEGLQMPGQVRLREGKGNGWMGMDGA